MLKNKNHKKLCIICEGYEEIEYIDMISSKNVFSQKYEVVTINAKSISKVFSRYQRDYSRNLYSIILIFSDTDKAPHNQYELLQKNINKFHEKNIDYAKEITVFANPCTMLIILSHFADVELKTQGKGRNADLIEELVGIKDYDAKEDQRKELFSKITQSNYKEMKNRIAKSSDDYTKVSSTNFIKLIDWLESDEGTWIKEINHLLID